MTRILLGVLLAALATACTSGSSTDPGGGDSDAEVFKTRMDAFVRDTLPKLQTEVGGEWGGYTAKFYEKGGNTGQWEYSAAGGTSRPPGTGKEVLDKVEAVLREQGMEITRPGVTSDIAGRKDGIMVIVLRALESDVESVSTLKVEFRSEDRLSSSDGFAENAGPTELLK
ncbi:hypothetical protein [Nocardioides sp. B-3]|uniref:hypothetical protein n=1 Tax=Nocardioides sp. B-3 TaxID=2895565 RepID=UPI002152077E|nr:hypothetical protein [Nocardioides sp. B-3]UUZ58637.1 hypothetical protein LP418_21280 [Nocardioides sp. B-3]